MDFLKEQQQVHLKSSYQGTEEKEQFTGLTWDQVKEFTYNQPEARNESTLNAAFAKAYIEAVLSGKFSVRLPISLEERYAKDRPMIIPRLMNLKEDFMKFSDTGDVSQEAVDNLFTQVNDKLWSTSSASGEEIPSRANELAVILGGKPATSGRPKLSIADNMVAMLLDAGAKHVVTASRSEVENNDERITHISGVDLFNGGSSTYSVIISKVCDIWKDLGPGVNIVFYFTLAQHGAPLKAKPNLNAAKAFSEALAFTPQGCDAAEWRRAVNVVVTGTDATNPSSTPGVTKYKIEEGNFYYAMSKLAQEHVLALRMLEFKEQTHTCNSTQDLKNNLEWMSEIIDEVNENSKDQEAFKLHQQRLDLIAMRQDKMQELSGFGIVKGLSIIFSTLHSPKYVKQAVSAAVPVVAVLANIVDRLKNAISLKEAAALHLTALQGNSKPSGPSPHDVASPSKRLRVCTSPTFRGLRSKSA